jgi:hypothetical protein
MLNIMYWCQAYDEVKGMDGIYSGYVSLLELYI